MLEQSFIGKYFLAAFLVVTALKLHLREQVPRHPIHLVKLAFVPAERTRVRVLSKPPRLAITA